VQNAKVSPEVVSQPAVHSAMEGMDLHEWFRRVHEWREGYSPLTLAPDYEVGGIEASALSIDSRNRLRMPDDIG
jgi:hypothetical protein